MKHCYLFLALVLVGCSSGIKQVDQTQRNLALGLPSNLTEALSSPFRTPQNLERDRYRHPLQTLAFFKISPEMTVVEISPGAGWYMEILAPYLAERGQYVGAIPPANNAYMTELQTKVRTWMDKYPQVGGKMKITVLDPAKKVDVAPAGSADLVLTFRNVHNWMTGGFAQEAFASFYRALKPGGILGVVEHRADPKSNDPEAKSGYVREADVIAFAKKAGFRLEEKSEINANPKDTKDHPEGVWTLPPTLKLGEKDKEKYLAIGESDRMTLRFVKPKK